MTEVARFHTIGKLHYSTGFGNHPVNCMAFIGPVVWRCPAEPLYGGERLNSTRSYPMENPMRTAHPA